GSLVAHTLGESVASAGARSYETGMDVRSIAQIPFWTGFPLKMHDEQPSAAITLPKPPKVIIFDLDGVILDSADIKLQGYKTIYANEDPQKLAALVEHCVLHGGITRRKKFAHYEREFFGRSGDRESVEALCRRYSDLVLKAVLACPFIDGAEQLLERARAKVQMHLV